LASQRRKGCLIYPGRPGAARVSVLLGDGKGGFDAPQHFAAGETASVLTSGDFNNDGRVDLAVVNFGSATVSVLAGNGRGQFAPAIHFGAAGAPRAVVAADFNNDGKVDLAVANRDSDTISIMINDFIAHQ